MSRARTSVRPVGPDVRGQSDKSLDEYDEGDEADHLDPPAPDPPPHRGHEHAAEPGEADRSSDEDPDEQAEPGRPASLTEEGIRAGDLCRREVRPERWGRHGRTGQGVPGGQDRSQGHEGRQRTEQKKPGHDQPPRPTAHPATL